MVKEVKDSLQGEVAGGDASTTSADESPSKMVPQSDLDALRSTLDKKVASERKRADSILQKFTELETKVNDQAIILEAMLEGDPEKKAMFAQATQDSEYQRLKKEAAERTQVLHDVEYYVEKGVPRERFAFVGSTADAHERYLEWVREDAVIKAKAELQGAVEPPTEPPTVPIGSAPAGDVGVAIADELSEVKTEIQNGINAGMNDRQLAPLRQKYYRLKAEQQGGKRRKTSKV